MSKRSPETAAIYAAALAAGRKADFVNREPIQEFIHWKIVHNEFPYDAIAKTCHMLVPKRKVALEMQLEEEERDELLLIKRRIADKYDMYMESPDHGRSVKDHFHLHLIQWK